MDQVRVMLGNEMAERGAWRQAVPLGPVRLRGCSCPRCRAVAA